MRDDSGRHQTWAVFGGSGFVGSAICRELKSRGEVAAILEAPRVSLRGARTADNIGGHLVGDRALVAELSARLLGRDVVVNAAGLASPDSRDTDPLFGANALLPVIIAEAAREAGVSRLLHLSSVAALGRDAPLHDRPETHPFSPYSASKALGEEVLLNTRSFTPLAVCVVRATSVHGPGRPTTAKLQRLARSPLASVASPGDQPSPVSSIYGLAAFVVDLGQSAGSLPPIALQPWEGATTTSVLTIASGGRRPRVIPRRLCRAAVTIARAVSSLAGGRFDGPVRRLELMWFGQEHHDAKGHAVSGDGLRRALTPSSAEGRGRG